METETTIITTLKLNEQEREWLKSLVQTPIGISYEDEPLESRKMRQTFWNALDKKR